MALVSASEVGNNARIIQDLRGHSSKTAEIYPHVVQRTRVAPFDGHSIRIAATCRAVK